MLLLALSALEATLTPVWYRALSEDAIRFVALNLNPYLNFISFALTLTMQILFVYALTKELRVSRIMWAIPASYATVNALGIFLTSQSLLRVSSYVSLAVEIASLAFTVLIIWRYKGFSNDEAQ